MSTSLRMVFSRPAVAGALLAAAAVTSFAAPPEAPDPASLLPPELPWDGASRRLMASPRDPWVTPAELTGLTSTPRYDETVEWLEKLVAAAPQLEMVSLGESAEGRRLWMVIASAAGATTPEELHRSGKPVLLAHGGIHSGEIDGKDAGLMLLRDLTVGGRAAELLEHASLLFIPILNVDGHERFSAFGRVNQRGPREMGWRTNGRNLNLNRDFAKLDTAEVRALVAALGEWRPDLYLDLHVTDGADYQYDITFGYTGRWGYSPQSTTWLDEVLRPALEGELEAQGHIPGPLIFLVDGRDPSRGNLDFTAPPRFSSAYGDARHLPTVLVENHSLKPYPQRVLGTYVLLAAALRTLGEHGGELRRAVAADRATRRDPFPLTFEMPERPPATMRFLGVESRLAPSPISGAVRQEWTGRPVTLEIPILATSQPDREVSRPAAYWIPAHWPQVIRRLELHGIETRQLEEPTSLEVEMYRLEDPRLEEEPFEGHVRVQAKAVAERRLQEFPAGSVRVSTDQPLGDLAMLLLEPGAPDSFFQWGFFHEVLQRTEYMEPYVAEALAERMLAEDPELAQEFQARLMSDPQFAADPEARLEFFYRRTGFWDERWRLYPVAREMNEPEQGGK